MDKHKMILNSKRQREEQWNNKKTSGILSTWWVRSQLRVGGTKTLRQAWRWSSSSRPSQPPQPTPRTHSSQWQWRWCDHHLARSNRFSLVTLTPLTRAASHSFLSWSIRYLKGNSIRYILGYNYQTYKYFYPRVKYDPNTKNIYLVRLLLWYSLSK